MNVKIRKLDVFSYKNVKFINFFRKITKLNEKKQYFIKFLFKKHSDFIIKRFFKKEKNIQTFLQISYKYTKNKHTIGKTENIFLRKLTNCNEMFETFQ